MQVGKMEKSLFRRLSMKKMVVASAMVAVAAMANDMDSRPAASVLTPVERNATFDNVPNLSEKENVDWQRLREERRVARQQILQNLRENSAAEKNALRPAAETLPAVEKPIESKPETPKNDIAREQKQDENPWMKNPVVEPPFGGMIGGPMGGGLGGGPMKFDPRKGQGRNMPMRPFEPRMPEKSPKVETPKRPDLVKDFPSRK